MSEKTCNLCVFYLYLKFIMLIVSEHSLASSQYNSNPFHAE